MTKEFWIFGYGSLMWRPGFDYVERHAAWIEGYHRALCVYSHVHRGTPERPGLVMGLDAGGDCRGVAFLVAPERRDATLAYLRARELVRGGRAGGQVRDERPGSREEGRNPVGPRRGQDGDADQGQ